MKFSEALQITQNQPADAAPFRATLACGFTPMHLQTFLAAHLQQRLPDRKVEVATGLYGDLAGMIEQLAAAPPDAAAIALEWADFDPRLQYRSSGGWAPSDLPAIVETVESRGRRFGRLIGGLPDTLRIAVSLPTLPLPPVFFTPQWQSSEAELRIRQAILTLGRDLAMRPAVAVISPNLLDEVSPPAGRLDFKGELLTGLPYTLKHAGALGQAMAELICPAVPMKGLITDLDDTLWSGVLGDAGVDGVTWDLAGRSQIHALYQQLLRALAEQGVLLGVASKNAMPAVEQAFARPDILLPKDRIFPLEVHWHSKSGSVARILKTWNIGADTVVYVDDSPMELAEVKEAHPQIHTLRFPKDDYASAASFLRNLRNLFGKARLAEEDALRLSSIRQRELFQRMAQDQEDTPEEFLARMQARLTADFENAPSDPRVLELVNKTNQFNLNGIRYTEAEWRRALEQEGAFAASLAYADRFGPLGKIAVVRGSRQDSKLTVGTWVMSCRAFARRIEHACVQLLFDRFAVESIEFEFAPTAKNGPVREFFIAMLGLQIDGPATVSRAAFHQKCPRLYHTVLAGPPAREGAVAR